MTSRRRRSTTSTRARWRRSDGTPRWPTCPEASGSRASIGWLAWLVLHLVMLIGVRNRVNVLVNWAWNYVTYDRASRIITNVDDVDDDS